MTHPLRDRDHRGGRVHDAAAPICRHGGQPSTRPRLATARNRAVWHCLLEGIPVNAICIRRCCSHTIAYSYTQVNRRREPAVVDHPCASRHRKFRRVRHDDLVKARGAAKQPVARPAFPWPTGAPVPADQECRSDAFCCLEPRDDEARVDRPNHQPARPSPDVVGQNRLAADPQALLQVAMARPSRVHRTRVRPVTATFRGVVG
jgi:hypothetical protein